MCIFNSYFYFIDCAYCRTLTLEHQHELRMLLRLMLVMLPYKKEEKTEQIFMVKVNTLCAHFHAQNYG